jgi:hypothetical protein
MTCIVGIANGTNVYIGADRSASDDITMVSMYRPKVHIKNDFIFGYSGSAGTGQLMEMINFNNIDEDPYYYIRLEVVKQLKNAMDAFGVVSDEHDAQFLIGNKGRLFELCTVDWSVIEVQESAVGSGGPIALGSLYTTSSLYTDNTIRIRIAIDAAIKYSPHCIGPIDVLYI